MIKVVLWDADGVTIGNESKYRYFSEKFSAEYTVPIGKILPFFKMEVLECQMGKADLKEELLKYLTKWGWKKSVEEFLEYWFAHGTELNVEVMRRVDELRAKGIKCYLATDQEKYRAKYILETVGLGEHFDGSFFSYELGSSKSQKKFFKKISQILGVKPEEMEFYDDEGENVRAAKEAGVKGKLFTSVKSFLEPEPPE